MAPSASNPPLQLDIFADSNDVMLRNDVADALQRREAPAARDAWQRLKDAFPRDPKLSCLQVLVDALERRSEKHFDDHDVLAAERDRTSHVIASAAGDMYGVDGASTWLAPLWREMAARSARLAFDGRQAEQHAAALWLLAGDWAAAAEAVTGIASWRRIPVPLGWMAEARCRLEGLDPAWPLLAELAWLAPARLDVLLRKLSGSEPGLERLRRKWFESGFELAGNVDDLVWFPAWVLTEVPALARHLALAQPSLHSDPERGMRLLLELLGLERQGRHHEFVARRRELRDLCRPLYDAYMVTR